MGVNDYLTVSALTQYLKRKFTADPYLKRVYLTGEISNFRLRPRHQYFSLKDQHAKISAIMFQNAFQKIKFRPEEGMKVLVVGYVSLYEANGQYQIYVEQMQPDGVGALYQAFEQLKTKLKAEGVFALPKKAIPSFPRRIAVITSASGAVIRDIITTVQRRFPIAQIVLFPAQVQGESAANSLVERLQQVNQQGDFDTIIIGRGGGSIEDLWPFNEERVARAILNSSIPVISSVGHETDTTIADYVADLRAPTPTAAAELATPVLQDLILQIRNLRLQLFQILKNYLARQRQHLRFYQDNYLLQNPRRLYQDYLQRVDQLTVKLGNQFAQIVQKNNQKFQLLQQSLRHYQPDLSYRQQLVMNNNKNLLDYYRNYLKHCRQNSQLLVSGLDDLSPLKTLKRGYAVVQQEERILTKVADVKTEQQLQIRLSDGIIKAQVVQVEEEKND
ncbi:exodeoxyribonuclease VII large subunit [Bombilactobacillus thymidiniphilus]|uniref:Exodeoxyribonuclease 7 large subunit n=1 Tax=Bombilactobacillus thymidiniphilus TaxID=2923363 RepID=A0ABY4PCG6_9LACO|nr:exodeoxyribonuclease VII large subunit [Bombilactobacillus thymidiniphilus]UQS83449.1 exodeoxyribonuclease VII large subunit [Bombilactobacillus thymidiniphilus]